MNKVTFAELETKVSRMPLYAGTLGSRIDSILDLARCNAEDTVFVEKARDASEYDAIALGSVESILCYSSDKPVMRWFARNGVKW